MFNSPEMITRAYPNLDPCLSPAPSPAAHGWTPRVDLLYPLAMSVTSVFMYCLYECPPWIPAWSPSGHSPPAAAPRQQNSSISLSNSRFFQILVKKPQSFCLQSWQWRCSSSLYVYKLQGWQLCNFLIKQTRFILPLTAGDPGPVNDWQIDLIFISSSILALLLICLEADIWDNSCYGDIISHLHVKRMPGKCLWSRPLEFLGFVLTALGQIHSFVQVTFKTWEENIMELVSTLWLWRNVFSCWQSTSSHLALWCSPYISVPEQSFPRLLFLLVSNVRAHIRPGKVPVILWRQKWFVCSCVTMGCPDKPC